MFTLVAFPNVYIVSFYSHTKDEKTYVFETFCAGPFHGHFHEFMGFLTPTKAPLNAATRAALTKRLVDAGWNPKYIQRVPTQNGC